MVKPFITLASFFTNFSIDSGAFFFGGWPGACPSLGGIWAEDGIALRHITAAKQMADKRIDRRGFIVKLISCSNIQKKGFVLETLFLKTRISFCYSPRMQAVPNSSSAMKGMAPVDGVEAFCLWSVMARLTLS